MFLEQNIKIITNSPGFWLIFCAFNNMFMNEDKKHYAQFIAEFSKIITLIGNTLICRYVNTVGKQVIVTRCNSDYVTKLGLFYNKCKTILK